MAIGEAPESNGVVVVARGPVVVASGTVVAASTREPLLQGANAVGEGKEPSKHSATRSCAIFELGTRSAVM